MENGQAVCFRFEFPESFSKCIQPTITDLKQFNILQQILLVHGLSASAETLISVLNQIKWQLLLDSCSVEETIQIVVSPIQKSLALWAPKGHASLLIYLAKILLVRRL